MFRTPWTTTRTLLGGWLLFMLGAAFLLLGSVRPFAQTLLHCLIGVGALLAARLSDRRLEKAGVLRSWVLAGSLLLAPLVAGFIYLPAAVVAWVSPGRLLARPAAEWVSMAADVGRVPGEISTWILVLSFGALVAVWGANARRSSLETATLTMAGVLGATMLGHALLGATATLGLLSPSEPGALYLAPLVNPDHSASLMILGGLVGAGASLDVRRSWWFRGAAAMVVLMAVGVIAWAGSVGATIAALGAILFWVLWQRTRLIWPMAALATAAVLAVQLWVALGSWGHGGFAGRPVLWHDSLHLIRDHWLMGVGGGNFGEAIRAYRSDMTFAAPVHAHDDLLEWVAETGLMGVLALVLALAALRPGPLRDARRAGALLAGGLGVALHALVDFPLQIPAIAMALTGVAACLVSVHASSRPAAARSVRRLILAVGLLQFPAAAWQAREGLTERAIETLRAFPADPARRADAARTLAALGARGPELTLAHAWEAERLGNRAEAIEAASSVGLRWPDRPDALRQAALLLARVQAYVQATELLDRVTVIDPSDKRPWVILARIAHASGNDLVAAEHWKEAFRRGETGLDEAWESLPLALYWLDAFDEDDADSCAELSQFLLTKGELQVALLASEQAERLDPEAYGRHLPRAMILLALGRAAEAETWLKPILAETPDNQDVLDTYARALSAQGRHDEATEIWMRASKERPDLRFMALRSTEAAGGLERALTLAHRFEIEGGIGPKTSLEIARLRQRSGNPAACVQILERWKSLPGPLKEQVEERLESCRRDLMR